MALEKEERNEAKEQAEPKVDETPEEAKEPAESQFNDMLKEAKEQGDSDDPYWDPEVGDWICGEVVAIDFKDTKHTKAVLVVTLSANVRETRSTQRIRVGRRQRKRTCWDCEREWKRMVVPLEPGRSSEARQLLRTQR